MHTKAKLILNDIISVFTRFGLSNSRLEDIAAAAGISKSTLYNYFGSKEKIFEALADREYRKQRDMLLQSVSPQKNLQCNVRTICSVVFDYFADHPERLILFIQFYTYFLGAMSSPGHSRSHLVRKACFYRSAFQTLLETVFAWAANQNEIEAGVVTNSSILPCVSVIEGHLLRSFIDRAPLNPEQITARVAAVVRLAT